MIEEEPQQQSQDIIEPEADAKSEESSSENVNLIEAIPEIHESPCEQEFVPKDNSEDEVNEQIREDNKAEQVENEKEKSRKRRIIKKEVRKQCLGKKPTFQHVGTRRRNTKSKLRKRGGSIRYYRDRYSNMKLYEKGVTQKEIHQTFRVQSPTLNKWKNQNQA